MPPPIWRPRGLIPSLKSMVSDQYPQGFELGLTTSFRLGPEVGQVAHRWVHVQGLKCNGCWSPFASFPLLELPPSLQCIFAVIY